jgi:hypothetical protein
MNTLVVLFFLFNVVATILLGVKFASQKENPIFKSFGIALLFNALAFCFWSFGVYQPESLLVCVTLGAVAFLISLVLLFYTSVQKSHDLIGRRLLILLSVFIVVGIFFIGRADPSYAFISEQGFLFFNLGPSVQMLYVFALALASLPAIDLVASKFKAGYGTLFRYALIAQVCGGIMLMTTQDANVLYITGWIIVVSYMILLVGFLFNKKVWIDLK